MRAFTVAAARPMSEQNPSSPIDEARFDHALPAAAKAAGGKEFIPRAAEGAEDNTRPAMPMLPLHLLKSEQSQESCYVPAMGGGKSSSMHKTYSVCSLDSSAMSCGGGFSDTASLASLAFGSSNFGEPNCGARCGEMPAVPPCFKCKFSHQVMHEPVRLPDGSLCDRANAASANQLKGEVKPDPLLAEAIKSYFELRRESERVQKEWQAWISASHKMAQEKMAKRNTQIHFLRELVEKSRKKVQALEERACPAKVAPETSSPETTSHRDENSETVTTSEGSGRSTGHVVVAGTASSESAAIVAEEMAKWRSGPAPRTDATAQATRKVSERRRSSWFLISPNA